jgi:hypothetical protein
VWLEEPKNGQPENVMEQAERPAEAAGGGALGLWISVAQSGRAETETHARQISGIPQCCSAATVFGHGAGDGNRTRTVSLGTNLMVRVLSTAGRILRWSADRGGRRLTVDDRWQGHAEGTESAAGMVRPAEWR